MTKKYLLYDVSTSPDAPYAVYPMDPPTILTAVGDWADQGYRLTYLQMSMHAGTHIDFPAHFIPAGKTAADYDLEQFILTAEVVYLDKVSEALAKLQAGEALLLKSQPDVGSTNEVSSELADQCVEKKLALVGFDQISIELGTGETFPAHTTLLGAGVLILENLDLSQVEPGRYQLLCWPLKVGAAEAAPVRAILYQENTNENTKDSTGSNQ